MLPDNAHMFYNTVSHASLSVCLSRTGMQQCLDHQMANSLETDDAMKSKVKYVSLCERGLHFQVCVFAFLVRGFITSGLVLVAVSQRHCEKRNSV